MRLSVLKSTGLWVALATLIIVGTIYRHWIISMVSFVTAMLFLLAHRMEEIIRSNPIVFSCVMLLFLWFIAERMGSYINRRTRKTRYTR